jgi:hypothetical protein
MKTLFDAEVYESEMYYWKVIGKLLYRRHRHSEWRAYSLQGQVLLDHWIASGYVKEVSDENIV